MNNSTIDFQIFGVTGYTVMSNYHLRDKNLSIRAKGLLSLMLSLPKEWDYSINGLVTLSKDGRDMVKSTLNELKEAQYVSIEKCRDTKGLYTYKYSVYYLPYPKWLEMSELSRDGFTTLVKPDVVEPDMDQPEVEQPEMVKPQQINNIIINKENKKDKKDKIKGLSYLNNTEHNLLTKELINRDYISCIDGSSFLFDNFFDELLKERSYKDLFVMVDYILKKIKNNNYKDEDGNEITNKYGYFKSAMLSNINKFENTSNNNYSGENGIFNYDWLNDDSEIREDLEL